MTAKVSENFGTVFPHFHRVDVYGTEGTFFNIPRATRPKDGDGDSSGNGDSFSTGLFFQSRDIAHLPQEVALAYPGVPKGVLLPEFVDALMGNGDIPISEQEILDVTAVCLAIDESVRRGEVITVDYGDLRPREG